VKNLRHLDAGGAERRFDDGSDIEFFTIGYRTRDYVQRFGAGKVRAADLDRDLSNGVQRRYALAGTVGNGMHVYDVTSPEDSFRVTRYDCPANQGDPQMFTREEEGRVRTFTTYTTDDSPPVSGDTVCGRQLGAAADARLIGTFIIEITDPYAPRRSASSTSRRARTTAASTPAGSSSTTRTRRSTRTPPRTAARASSTTTSRTSPRRSVSVGST
jgi:hypothetical protein